MLIRYIAQHGLRPLRRPRADPPHRPRLRRGRGEARRGGARPRKALSLRDRGQARRAGADGDPVPGVLRRGRGRLARLRARRRGAHARGLLGGDHDVRAHLAGHPADLPVRQRGAEAAADARPVRGQEARGVRADRAGGGKRCGQRPHAREARRRRLGHRRRQAVHHQRRHGDLGPRRDHGPDRRRRDLQPDRRERHRGLQPGRAVPQDGLERLRHAPADVRGLPGARGEPARPARAGLQAVPAHPGHRPHRRRGHGRRPRAGRARRGARLRETAARVRQADLDVPVDPGQARGHLDGDRGCAAARLQGGAAQGRRAQLQPDRRAGEAQDRPPGGARDGGGRADPRRLRLHRGVPGVPLLPRRQDPHDRRGHRRGAADGDREGAGGVIEPVLIANRGEIAVRIAATARRLGLASVAVFTPVDADAPHVDAADVAVEVGSYLDADAVVEAARRSGARSVHPGYGFLSENAAFARAVEAAGLAWIGPPPEAIELMGDKARAKALAREAGVPVLPGVEGDDVSLEQMRAFADEHGYPVVIKAVAGGGGKGMRAARDANALEAALDAARREGKAAFGDSRVLVERYLERPRHIEIQVLADAHGAVVHLGERECSLQRRHQKVVEEAPSPVVGDELRARMGEAAVELTRACGYAGAGTVEFITPPDASAFFFLEMNTRLQVEHPVTELVYGVDLVEQQLRVAAGEPLALEQAALRPQGHAVEARLYAEDPANGFLPAVGTVRRYVEPPGARMDSGIREGSIVGTDYDPMLAKVIVHAQDRPSALRRLARALGELQLLGVATNAAFSRALLEREDVRAGEIDTGLLERILAGPRPELPEDLVPAAAVAAAGSATPAGPWRMRFEEHGEVRVDDGRVRAGEREWRASLRPAPDSGAPGAAAAPHGTVAGSPEAAGGLVRVALDGISRRYAFARDGDTLWIARDGHHLELRVARAARGSAAAAADSLEAPMPGTVLLVHAQNGQAVEEGEVLLVIESMKMELSIAAPHAGTVEGLDVEPGDKVGLRQVLAAVVA